MAETQITEQEQAFMQGAFGVLDADNEWPQTAKDAVITGMIKLLRQHYPSAPATAAGPIAVQKQVAKVAQKAGAAPAGKKGPAVGAPPNVHITWMAVATRVRMAANPKLKSAEIRAILKPDYEIAKKEREAAIKRVAEEFNHWRNGDLTKKIGDYVSAMPLDEVQKIYDEFGIPAIAEPAAEVVA